MKYKSLEITEEEKEALKEYCEWNYMFINLLTSGDMDAISKFNNDRLNIFSKEYFEKSMETLKNIYSAMVKYSYNKKSESRTLIRGTTVAEIETFKGEYTKMLSTSVSEEAVKTHAGSKVINGFAKEKDRRAAIISLDIVGGELPFINVNRVLEDESNHDREEEIILAPFGIVDEIQKVSRSNCYEYYNATIKSQALEKVDNLDDIKERVFDNINKIPEIVRECNSCNIKLETVNHYLQMPQMPEDRAVLSKTKQELYEKIPRLKEEFSSIRQAMVQYAKGICYEQKEKVDRDVRKEESAIEEEFQNKQKAEFKNRQQDAIKGVLESTKSINNCVKKLSVKNNRYEIVARRLDLQLDVGISNEVLENTVINLQTEIADMNKKLESGTLNDGEKQIQEYLKKAEEIKKITSKIEGLEANYNDENYANNIKSILNKKIDTLIKENEVKKIEEEIKKIDRKEMGFFDRILGKDKELELKKEQLVLRKKLLEMKPIRQQDDCSAHEMMAKIIDYKNQNNGVLPDDLKKIPDQMRTVFKIEDKRVNAILMDMTQPLSLIPVQKEKSSIFNRRKNISKMQAENAKLSEDVNQLRKEGAFDVYSEASNSVTMTPQTIYNEINKIRSIVNERNISLEQSYNRY